MLSKFLYLPTEFSDLPASEVGSSAVSLAKLQKLAIPTTKAIVLPKNTLKIIAQANRLQAKVYNLLQTIDYSSSTVKKQTCSKLEHLIRTQSIPTQLAKELLDSYSNYFEESFVLIKNSETLPFREVILENIYQDTNFVDAILEVWAKMASSQLQELGGSKIHDILFPSPILVQEQLEPKVSGVAYSYDLEDGSKNRITVLSSWGVYLPQYTQADSYFIDVRTQNISKQYTQTKLKQFRRVLGKLREDDVLNKEQTQASLTKQRLTQILKIVSKIKQKHLAQVAVSWGIQNNQLFVEAVKEVEIETKKLTKKEKTFFKLYSTIDKASTITNTKKLDEIDGVVIYNSGRLLAATATHPNEVLKTKQRDYLIEAIARFLSKVANKTSKPLVYRANNFTTQEFSQLKFATLYETPENNPYLGFRGALRFISQQKVFQLELDALVKLLQNTSNRVTLVLPFVRSQNELAELLKIIKKHGLTKYSHFNVWLELSTPENVLNLRNYPVKQIQGVVFNTQSIHALLTGIDPGNSDITVHYKKNIPLLKQLIESGIEVIKQTTSTKSIDQQPQVFVDLSSYDKTLLAELCDLKINGFIVNEQVTELAKKCIIDTQYSKIK